MAAVVEVLDKGDWRPISSIDLKPGFTAELADVGDGDCQINVIADEAVPNAWHQPNADTWYEFSNMFPDGIILEVPIDGAPWDLSEREIATMVMTARIVSEFHEEFEWVKVNGVRLADPHPGPDEGEMWNWLYGKIRGLVDEYVERYPVQKKSS